jgi:hypothetical protein
MWWTYTKKLDAHRCVHSGLTYDVKYAMHICPLLDRPEPIGDDDVVVTADQMAPMHVGLDDMGKRLQEALEADPNGTNAHTPGAKLDSGKPRWDLLPLEVIEGVVRVMSVGAAKYSPDGWKSVPDGDKRYFSAMMRHWMKMQAGEYLDDGPGGTGEPHWGCFLTNAVFLSYYALRSQGE